MERKNKSPVWRVFIKDAAHKRTVCTQCGKEFKYRYTTTNLRDHLKRYHPEWLPDSGVNSTVNDSQLVSYNVETRNLSVNDSQLVAYPVETRNVSIEIRNSSCVDSNISDDCEHVRKNKSAVWQVFVKDSENKNVTCTLCQKEFKFWNNTTNLRAHLRRTHPEWRPESRQSFAESGEEIEDDEQADTEGRHSSASSSSSYNETITDSLPNSESFVWRVFVKGEIGKGVFCTLCQKDFSSLNNTWSMIDHLRRLHPDWEQPTRESKTNDLDDDTIDQKEQSCEMLSKSVFLVSTDRKNRSPVWDVFMKDVERKRTVCTICKKDFKCWNNTANLLDHLRRIHPKWKPGCASIDVSEDSSGRKRPTIARITNSISSENSEAVPSLHYIQSSLSTINPSIEMKSKRIDSIIGEMICMDFQNLSIVDDAGFKKLMKELLPNYSLPNRKVIVKQTLPELYENVCKHIQQKLRKCKYVAVSVELWTNQAMEGFMTLTVHYFANDEYTSSVLQTERISTDHSSEDLASVMHRIFDHWKIFDKITAIVADDDAALKAACNMLNITHIPCIAQLLNNIITEELTENDEAQLLLQRCLNLVAHFKLNPSAADILHDIQSQMGHTVLNLKQVAPTRWNSALHMAQRLVEIKEPLSTTLVAMPEGPQPISTNEWLNLDDFITVLKPFELMTSELSADSYCNISKVVPLVRGVQSSLQNVNCVSDLGAAMKKSLLEKLDARFQLYEKYMIPSVATLLDPRFKRAGLGVESAIDSTRTFVTEQLSEMKNNARKEESEKTDDEKSAVPNSDIWNFLDEKVNEMSSREAPLSYAAKIVMQYLELPYLKRHDCPFKFWNCQGNLEPELADIAMKFMCIPATSFPAERLYSKSGIIMTDRRNKMATKHFDTIIFLNKNL